MLATDYTAWGEDYLTQEDAVRKAVRDDRNKLVDVLALLVAKAQITDQELATALDYVVVTPEEEL